MNGQASYDHNPNHRELNRMANGGVGCVDMEGEAMMHLEEIHTIEALIDRYGLAQVLTEVSQLATDKAAHIRENWQDDKLAAKWSLAAHHVAIAAERVRKLWPR